MDELASKYKEQNALAKNQSNKSSEQRLEGSKDASVEGLSRCKDVALDFSPLET
jgi:hypothetical protein